MKTGRKNTSINTLFFMLFPLLLSAQYSKTYSESFQNVKELELINRRGNIDIRPAQNGETRYELLITLEAKSQADANSVFDNVKVNVSESGTKLKLEPNYGFRGIQTVNGKTSITFQNKSKVKNIRKFKVNLVVYTNDLTSLSVTAKYNNLDIAEGITQAMNLELHSNEINIGSIPKKLSMEAKYSEGTIGNTGDASLELYDCDFSFGTMGNVNLESKYSEMEVTSMTSLIAETYDDDFKIRIVAGDLKITDKYSEFTFESSGNAWLDIYDAEFDLKKGGNLMLKSKYSDFQIGEVEAVDCEVTYDDDIRIQSATKVTIRESKYSDMSFGMIKTSFAIDSFDDNISINDLGSNFERLSFNGKYTDLKADLKTNFDYRFRANTKYGELGLNEDRFDVKTWIEKNGALTAEGQTKNATSSSALITIEGVNNNISLR